MLALLRNIQQSGTFCAKKHADASHLKIHVKDTLGGGSDLKYPISARQVKSLIKLAQPAKYGWKDQTLYDPSIRNGWEIKKSKLQIDNRLWNKILTPLLDQFKSVLGLPQESRITAHLHNLLIYEKGQFFSTHQDSEKLDGMVASLVVVLPSEFRGGTLAIDHHGEKKRFTAASTSKDKLTLIAFYADCHHEVTPVTEGYRVALTYNLVLENAASPPVLSPGQIQLADALREPLQAYFNPPRQHGGTSAKTSGDSAQQASDRVRKWIYLLDHQYTQGSLLWNRLKSEDQTRVDALRQAAKSLDLEAHLALIDVQETWDCEDDHNDWGRYGRRNYWHYDDDEEDEDEVEENTVDGHVLRDLIDNSLHLTHCIDEQNQAMNASGLYLNSEEICWSKATDQFDPFQSDYEGYMGNYGNTLDRWYHRAAIILWRREDHFAVLSEIDAITAIKELLHLAKAKSTLSEAQKQVTGMLPYWERNASRASDGKLATNVFKLALKIVSAELARALLLPLGINVLSAETAKVLAELAHTYGDDWCLRLLKDWTHSSPRALRNYAASLERFGSIIEALIASQRTSDALIDWLFEYQLEHVKKENNLYLEYESVQESKKKTQGMLELIYAANCAANAKAHAAIIDYLMQQPGLFSMFDLALTAKEALQLLSGIAFQAWGYSTLLDFTIARIKERVSKGLRASDDWSIERRSNCNCDYCGRLNQFLSSHSERNFTWPLNKERRAHIHQTIDKLGVPVTHQTRREGSPQKLILTKTDQLFAQDRHEFQNAECELSILERLKKGSTS